MNVSELIRIRRNELHLTLEEVGVYVGVSKSTVKKWEDGFISNMKRDKIASLAKILQLNPVMLIDPDADVNYKPIPPYENIIPLPKTKQIPLVGDIACGAPILAEENITDFVSMPENTKADFALRCRGDSMIGARILDGDIVYIKEAPKVENGEIAAVLIGEEATLKRVNYYPEKSMLILKPENPKYNDLIYIGEELNSIHILGKAVAFQSDII